METAIAGIMGLIGALAPIASKLLAGQMTDEEARAEARAAWDAFAAADVAAREREAASDAKLDRALAAARALVATLGGDGS